MIKKCFNWCSDHWRSLSSIAFDVARIAASLIAIWRFKNYIVNIVVLTVWIDSITGLIWVYVAQPEDLYKIPKWRTRLSLVFDLLLCVLLAGMGWLVTSGVFGVETCLATARCLKAHRDFEETD